MRRITVLALIVLLLAPALCAQGGDTPSREEVLKLMEVLNAKRQLKLTLDGMTEQLAKSMAEQMRKKVPDANADQQKLMDEFVDGVRTDMRSVMKDDEMLDLLVPVYQKHLTRKDVQRITEFYSSPAGQSFVQKMPVILGEALKVGSDYGRSREGALEELIQKRLADFEVRVKEMKTASPKSASSTPANK